jgi:hypothetical protein
MGVEEGIGFKYFGNFFFILLTVKFTLTTGIKNFFKEVGNGANNVSFTDIGGGEMNSFFKYF